MPKGIVLVKWDNKLGTILEMKYPDELVVTPNDILQFFTSQTMGDISQPRFGAFYSENIKIVSYFGGFKKNFLVIFYLDEDEHYEDYSPFILDIFNQIISNRERGKEYLRKILQDTRELLIANKEPFLNKYSLNYKLLNEILMKEITFFEPKIDEKFGIRYDKVEEILNVSPNIASSLLLYLSKIGLIEAVPIDFMLVCPTCNASNIEKKSHCPYCQSLSLKPILLLEHFSCGSVFPVDRKVISRCEACNEKLMMRGVDYQIYDGFSQCKNCNRFFDSPKISYYCNNCKKFLESYEIIPRDIILYKPFLAKIKEVINKVKVESDEIINDQIMTS
ncbi:MAG: hypothetical protein ACTSVY_09675 [Candidatus Helarchaeota archaeon]